MKIEANIIIFVCLLIFESMFKRILFVFFMMRLEEIIMKQLDMHLINPKFI